MVDEHAHHASHGSNSTPMNVSGFNDPHSIHSINHSFMDHGSTDHSSIDHSSMDHGPMDHSSIDHSSMDHGSMHSGHGDHSDHQGHMMFFHCSSESTILFSFWQTNSVLTMLLSCMAIVIMGILYEGLKTLREKLLLRNGCCEAGMCGPPQIATVATSSFNDATADGNCCSKKEPFIRTTIKKTLKQSMWSKSHLLQSLLHGAQILLSYFIMLIFMTYNVWPCASVVVGATLGYFLFSWRRHKCPGCVPASEFVISDHCH